jgi:hypothetical protein
MSEQESARPDLAALQKEILTLSAPYAKAAG